MTPLRLLLNKQHDSSVGFRSIIGRNVSSVTGACTPTQTVCIKTHQLGRGCSGLSSSPYMCHNRLKFTAGGINVGDESDLISFSSNDDNPYLDFLLCITNGMPRCFVTSPTSMREFVRGIRLVQRDHSSLKLPSAIVTEITPVSYTHLTLPTIYSV